MVVVVLGVSGSGKTTVGQALAERLRWEFVDGDEYHSPANKAKMGRGIPLTDVDREPWLEAMRDVIFGWLARGTNGVLACSALKKSYRDRLRAGPEVRFVYLKRDSTVLEQRLRERTNHFAGPILLSTQLESLEEPSETEPATITMTTLLSDAVTDEIISKLGLEGR